MTSPVVIQGVDARRVVVACAAVVRLLVAESWQSVGHELVRTLLYGSERS
jgi:hypothetical protein